MENKKSKNVKKTYLKGYEPKTLRFKSGRRLTTNGLTKQEWDPVKKKFKPEDKVTAKTLLSI